MSRNARKILIETDVRETFSIRIGQSHVVRSYCESCGTDDQMIDLNAAVTASGVPASELIDRIAAGTLHSPKTVTGHLFICLGSLKRQPDLENRNYETSID